MKTYPILIVQTGILTGYTLKQNGLLHVNGDEFTIDLNGDNVFYKFPDTKSSFKAVWEFEDGNIYECFELTLNEDYDLEEFEVEKDKEYRDMKAFLLKGELEEHLSSDFFSKNKLFKIAKV